MGAGKQFLQVGTLLHQQGVGADAGVSQLLAHEEPAILLDMVSSFGAGYLEAQVKHDKKSLYSDEHGNVPAWVGLEYMAQAIEAYAGIESLKENKPVRIGLLLGTSRYKVFTELFRKSRPVTIKVQEVFRDEKNVALFDCKILECQTGQLLATAHIKAILPEDIDEIIGES